MLLQNDSHFVSAQGIKRLFGISIVCDRITSRNVVIISSGNSLSFIHHQAIDQMAFRRK